MNKSHLWVAILLSGSLSSLSTQTFAAVQASLSQSQIGQNDTVQLTLQQTGSSRGEPDLTPLKRDFDIIGTSRGSNIQIINGSISQQAQVQVSLSPKHSGNIAIPPLQWGNDHTQALALIVNTTSNSNSAHSNTSNTGQSNTGAATTAVTTNNAHVFIETTLNDKQPYVQGAVLLTLKLYTDQQLYQASLDLTANNDILVQQLGKDEQHSETRNGQGYQVIQRQYLLTPQRSGQLHLDGPILNAQIAEADDNDPFGNMPFGGMLTSTRPILIHGNPITLDVHPRPVDSTGHDLIPAAQLNLQENWKPDQTTIKTGEPLTRHLHLSAQGLMGNALPDLSSLMQLPDGLRAYPDQAKTNTTTQDGKIIGSSDQDIALIANQPGHYILPALKLTWWDSTQHTQREITLPARTVDVTGAAINATSASSEHQTSLLPALQGAVTNHSSPSSPIWHWISLALGGLWTITLGGWWWDHRRLVQSRALKTNLQQANTQKNNTQQANNSQKSDLISSKSGKQAMKDFIQACQNNQALGARHHLLAWANHTWKENPPTGLNALAAKLSDPHITKLLEELDRACYGAGHWNGQHLATAFNKIPLASKAAKSTSALDELYPD